jgi:hypothetical protein
MEVVLPMQVDAPVPPAAAVEAAQATGVLGQVVAAWRAGTELPLQPEVTVVSKTIQPQPTQVYARYAGRRADRCAQPHRPATATDAPAHVGSLELSDGHNHMTGAGHCD